MTAIGDAVDIGVFALAAEEDRRLVTRRRADCGAVFRRIGIESRDVGGMLPQRFPGVVPVD